MLDTKNKIEKLFGHRYTVSGLIYNHDKAIIYKAFDTYVNRKVVIKTSIGLSECFSREMEFMYCSLDNNSAPKLYDYREVGQRVPAIVMEYIDGVTLEQIIKYNINHCITPSYESSHFILKSILFAMRELKQYLGRDFVHGDICPANIMLTSTGDLKIIDLNLGSIQMWSIENFHYGRPDYEPPEMTKNVEYDPRKLEVYSIKATAIEFCTNYKYKDILENVSRFEISDFNKKLPTWFCETLKTAMSDNHRKRRKIPGVLVDIFNNRAAPIEECPKELKQIIQATKEISSSKIPDVRLEVA